MVFCSHPTIASRAKSRHLLRVSERQLDDQPGSIIPGYVVVHQRGGPCFGT